MTGRDPPPIPRTAGRRRHRGGTREPVPGVGARSRSPPCRGAPRSPGTARPPAPLPHLSRCPVSPVLQVGPAAPRHPPGAGEPLTNAHCALGDSTVRVTAANLLLGHRCAATSLRLAPTDPRFDATTPASPPCHSGEGLRRAKESPPHPTPLSCLQRLLILGPADL